ncbi:hypothetical protein ACFFX1_06475 [Dactylosporangium sucinum]|nr:hypothetical protein [Dactylosporangium sucinum]
MPDPLAYDDVQAAAARLRGQRVGAIVSGGNVDADRFAVLMTA